MALIGVAEMADYLGMSERKVRNLIAEGMPCYHIGARYRLDRDEALAWLRDEGETEDDSEEEDEEEAEDGAESEDSEEDADEEGEEEEE